ncbi:MAG: acetyltransferase, family [Mycobacterium sp.]|nr:acetyltransferase, family [Mycobacterium sp.]
MVTVPPGVPQTGPVTAPLRTDRLVLVPVSPPQARAIVGGDLSGLRAGPDWPSPELVETLSAALEYGGALGWFVTLDGVVIGDCGVHGGVDAAGDVEIGYGIAPSYRRCGYATEVVGALSRWAGEQPAVRRVVARRVLADNVGSRRALERSGFAVDEVAGRYVGYALSTREGHGK